MHIATFRVENPPQFAGKVCPFYCLVFRTSQGGTFPFPEWKQSEIKFKKSHNSVVVFDDHHAVVKVRCGPTELGKVYKTFFIRNLQIR